MMHEYKLRAAILGLVGLSQAQTDLPYNFTLENQDVHNYINYRSVQGYFLQDDPATNVTAFDYTQSNFGLIDRTYPAAGGSGNLTQWQRFAQQVDALNANASRNTAYKVLFMGRHGEGYHNAAESFYGTPAWNCYWSEQIGNATANWADADLTPDGIEQAEIANRFWRQKIEEGIPVPQTYYTSPLTRCLRTADISFSGLDLPYYYPFVPTVKECFREGISIHTCDRRSNRTYIENRFPTFEFERGFTEFDELWSGARAETSSAQDYRSKRVLDEVFAKNDHTYISITSHSGEIRSLLRTLNHREFSLSTGQAIPVLVEARFLPLNQTVTPEAEPWELEPWCHNAPPATSLADTGCVCSGTATASAGMPWSPPTATPTATASLCH